ncbi:uncharacterized protein DFL_008179 [Arthrobotrys flagrans]|uniref:Uncharacterized protein n=1 Tax=Arthrobotrys flagrans TaxID=97331 RepID=A0A436ZMZ9_ARTFL|nr:hypothetical protein DFL_008179 [Arthrobotrys flagrans]
MYTYPLLISGPRKLEIFIVAQDYLYAQPGPLRRQTLDILPSSRAIMEAYAKLHIIPTDIRKLQGPRLRGPNWNRAATESTGNKKQSNTLSIGSLVKEHL